jgi:ATP-dependent Clp protease ATP-binding subunit ClpA
MDTSTFKYDTDAKGKARFKIPDDTLEELIFRFARDISAQVAQDRFDPIIGRDKELYDLIMILLQRERKNVLLLAGAGVGKTALFIGLAQMVQQNKVPKKLKGARILEIEMSSLSAGAASRSDFEGRFVPLIRAVAERNASKTLPPIILCIDEIHMIMPACIASGAAGVADLMKPYLTTGDLMVIGATTRDEYDDFVKTDPALDRRFQKIFLEPPNEEECKVILRGLKYRFAQHYDIKISDEICDQIVYLTTKYLRRRNHPDKAILTLDQACARSIMSGKDSLDMEDVRNALAHEAGILPTALI